MMNGSNAQSSASSSHTFNGGSLQTIEEQIKHVDRFIKDCETSRKNMEQINRRLDELNDEVRRYREFLGYEKSRRDPALYKTSNMEQPSQHNENICGIIGTLTNQLALEWGEKLRSIQTTTLSTKYIERN